MYQGQTASVQLMQHLPWTTFRRIVNHYRGDRSGVACAAGINSEPSRSPKSPGGKTCAISRPTCLGTAGPDLYRAGFRRPIRRYLLSRANERHDWHIFAEFAQNLLDRAARVRGDNYYDRRVASFPDATHRPHEDATASPLRFAAVASSDL